MEMSTFRRMRGWIGNLLSGVSGEYWPDSRLLIESCPEGIVHARDGVIVHVNPALLQAFDCDSRDLLGQPLTGFLPSRDRSAWLELLDDLREAPAGQFVESEFTVRTRNGAAHRQVILRLARNEVAGREQLIVFVEDVTGLRRSESALRDHARRLRELARQVIDVQEAERRHLARELHDEIGQQLTLLKMSLLAESRDSSAKLLPAIEQVDALTSQVRSLSLDLRPSMLDDLGLVAALRWYVKRTQEVTGLEFDADLPESFPRLSPDLETAFFRVAQESINNAVKHSQAHCVSIGLGYSDARATLSVSDDGAGFDSSELLRAAHEGSSGGLLGMQERAALVGADVQVFSEPDRGCQVIMTSSAGS